MVAAVNYICDFGAVPRSTRGSLDFGAITTVQRVWAKFSETVGFWRVSGNPPKVDVRGIQPARSSHNADFAGLNDLREMALAGGITRYVSSAREPKSSTARGCFRWHN